MQTHEIFFSPVMYLINVRKVQPKIVLGIGIGTLTKEKKQTVTIVQTY